MTAPPPSASSGPDRAGDARPGLPVPPLPAGTVAFLFTDIEGSTRLWERDPAAMRRTAARHDALLRAAVERHRGHLFKHVGDAVQAAFPTAADAVAAAAAGQRAVAAADWGAAGPLRVRMAVHVGEAAPTASGDYHQVAALNRLARLLATGHGGQVLLTDAAAQLARPRLPDGAALRDLGRHRLRDLLEPERVWQLDLAGLPTQFPPLRSLEGHPTNLPAQPNALLGRDDDLRALAPRLTDPATRLLTLTGPGGVGKTRLALQLAADTVDAFPDGVFLVGLAALSDPALLSVQIADTLGVREEGGSGLREALTAFLAGKRLLLVLDNLEQFRPLAPAARLVADLLAAAPGLTVLATSRAPLRLRTEQEAPVAPLPTPGPAATAGDDPVAALAGNPAVGLFVERARAARPGFALAPGNAAAVAEIVRRLDGLPLAIELAAARSRVLAPAELARRLGGALDLLATRAADAPDRQQTLRATIAWSHDLLAPGEQALFRRLSVFPGGCTLEAAEAVADVPTPLGADPLDGIDRLVEQSLLRAEEAGDGTRYRMLETLRAYGRERLAEAGEEAALLAARDRWLHDLVVEAGAHLIQADAAAWFDRLEAEHANLAASFADALEGGRAGDGLATAAQLWGFWRSRGHLAEGRAWLDRLLAAAVAPTEPRLHGLEGAAMIASDQGEHAVAAERLEEAVDLARQLGDEARLAVALNLLGSVRDRQGRLEEAAALLRQSLELGRAQGDRRAEAGTLNNLAIVLHNQGDLAEASRLLEASLRIKQEMGNRLGMSVTVSNLAVLAHDQGDVPGAVRWLEEAIALDREIGNPSGLADDLDNLGGIHVSGGDPPRGAALLAEALATRREIGDRYSLPYSLANVAALAAAVGDHDVAARLSGAQAALLAETGTVPPPPEQARIAEGIARVRAALGDFATDAALAAGRAMGWEAATEEALAYARRVAAGPAPPPVPADDPTPDPAGR